MVLPSKWLHSRNNYPYTIYHQAWFYLLNISLIHQLLPIFTATQLIHAATISHYCKIFLIEFGCLFFPCSNQVSIRLTFPPHFRLPATSNLSVPPVFSHAPPSAEHFYLFTPRIWDFINEKDRKGFFF